MALSGGSVFVTLGAHALREGFDQWHASVLSSQQRAAKGVHVRLGGDFVKDGFERMGRQMAATQGQGRDFQAAMARYMAGVNDGFKGVGDSATRYLGLTREQLGYTSREYETVAAAAAHSAEIQKRAMQDVGVQAGRTAEQQRVAAQTASTGVASAADKAATSQVSAARKADAEWKKGFSTLANAGKYISIGAAAIGVISVKMAADFNKQMELVHTQAGYSQIQVEKLKKSVEDLAPAVGFGPTKLAEGLYRIASSGIPASESMNVLRVAAEGAKVGASGLEETTNTLLYTLRGFNIPVSDAAKTMDMLDQIAAKGNMRFEELTKAMSSGIIGAARAFGLGMKDVGSALDVLTVRGVPAEQAATRLRTTLSLIAAPTGKAQKALAELGLGTTSLADDLRKGGLPLALEDLRKHMDNVFGRKLNYQEQQQAIQTYQNQLIDAGVKGAALDKQVQAFTKSLQRQGEGAVQSAQLITQAFGGARMGTTMQLLMQNVGEVQQRYDQLGKDTSAKDFAQRWHDTQKQFSEQASEIWAGIQKILIQLGEKLIPVVRSAVRAFLDFANWLGKHKAAAEALAITLGVLLTGAVVAFVGKLVGKMAEGTASVVRFIVRVDQIPGKLLKWGESLYKTQSSQDKTIASTDALTAALTKQTEALAAEGAAAVEASAGLGRLAVTQEAVTGGGLIIPRGKIGGAGGLGKLEQELAGGGGAAATAEEAALAGGGGGGLLSRLGGGARGLLGGGLKGILGGVLKGGGIAMVGGLGANIAGGLIGGKAGHAVSSIGGDAAIGAGLGSLIGPEGTIAGGILGAGVGALTSLIGHAETAGQKMGTAVGDGMKKTAVGAMPAVTKIISQGIDEANKHMPKLNPMLGGTMGTPKPSGAQDAAVQKAYYDTGVQAAKAWGQGMQSQPKYLTFSWVLQSADAMMKKLPPQMQLGALTSIKSWADEMVKEGRLPRDAANRLVSTITKQFNLSKRLPPDAKNAMDGINKVIKDSHIVGTVQSQVDGIKKNWQGVPKVAKTTADNAVSNWQRMMEFLERRLREAKGKTDPYWKGVYRDALASIKDLNKDVKPLIDQTVDHFLGKVRDQKGQSDYQYSQMVANAVGQLGKLRVKTQDAFKDLHVNPIRVAVGFAHGLFGGPGGSGGGGPSQPAGGVFVGTVGTGKATGGLVGWPGAITRAAGGPVAHPASYGATPPPGSTDSVPGWLTLGEYVVQKSATQQHGLSKMNAINRGEDPSASAAVGGMLSAAAVLVDTARALGADNPLSQITTIGSKVQGSVTVNRQNPVFSGGFAAGGLVSSFATGGPVAGIGMDKSTVDQATQSSATLRKKLTEDFTTLANTAKSKSQVLQDEVTKSLDNTHVKGAKSTKGLHDDSLSQFTDLEKQVNNHTTKIHDAVDHGFSDTRSKGTHSMKGLHDDTEKHMSDTESSVATHSQHISNTVSSQFENARHQGGQKASQFAQSVAGSFGSMDSAVATGSTYIGTAVNEALKALQIGQIKFGVDKPPGLSAHAGGGSLPGREFGKEDHMLLIDPHGRARAKLAGNEWVFNDSQKPYVEMGLQMLGFQGADDLWNTVRSGHTAFNHGGELPGYAVGGVLPLGWPKNGQRPKAQGYVFPFPKGSPVHWERVDQGQDIAGPPGGDVLAVADGTVSMAPPDPSGFGDHYPLLLVTAPGPLRGKTIYYGHTKAKHTGPIHAGDVISQTGYGTGDTDWQGNGAAIPGHLEIGFWPPGGMTSGSSMATIMHALEKHQVVGGSADMLAPKVTGPATALRDAAQAALNKMTSSANKFVSKKAAAALPGMAGGIAWTGAPDEFMATAYGPPWGGIQGGGTTATGIKLPSSVTGKPGPYIIAVDPSVIPMHTKLHIQPNPFNYSGYFQAEDTGGAIKGHRIDFLDMFGRAHQDAWGFKAVRISRNMGGRLGDLLGFQRGGRVRAAHSPTYPGGSGGTGSSGTLQTLRTGRPHRNPNTRLQHQLNPSSSTASRAASLASRKIKQVLPHKLLDMLKFGNLPDIGGIDEADLAIAAVDKTYQTTEQYMNIVDQTLTPDDLAKLMGLRGNEIALLQQEAGIEQAAGTDLASLATTTTGRRDSTQIQAQKVLTSLNKAKRDLTLEGRRVARLRHKYAGQMLTIADKLAHKEANIADSQSTIHGRQLDIRDYYRKQLAAAHNQAVPDVSDAVQQVRDSYADAIANAVTTSEKRGLISKREHDISAIRKGRRGQSDRKTALIRALSNSEAAQLSELRHESKALTDEARHLREQEGSQRRKFRRKDWKDVWTIQLKKWKLQDKIATLRNQEKQLSGSTTEIGKGGVLGELTKELTQIDAAQQTLADQKVPATQGALVDDALAQLQTAEADAQATADKTGKPVDVASLIPQSILSILEKAGLASGAIHQIYEPQAGTTSPTGGIDPAALVAELGSMASAQEQLFQQFGSNYVAQPGLRSALEGGGSVMGAGVRYFGAAGPSIDSGLGLGPTGGAPQALGPSSTVNNTFEQHNTYASGPSDPHIHAQVSAQEFQGAFG